MVNKNFQRLLVMKWIYGYIELQVVFIIKLILNMLLCLKSSIECYHVWMLLKMSLTETIYYCVCNLGTIILDYVNLVE